MKKTIKPSNPYTIEDSFILKNLRANPMFKFDARLQSLEKDLLEYNFLTPEQQDILKKVKTLYLPKVLLKPNQADFLRKMSSLPANRMSSAEKSIIAKMYAKACAGDQWQDEERILVSGIMKKYKEI